MTWVAFFFFSFLFCFFNSYDLNSSKEERDIVKTQNRYFSSGSYLIPPYWSVFSLIVIWYKGDDDCVFFTPILNSCFYVIVFNTMIIFVLIYGCRKEYEKLRRECRRLLKHSGESYKLKESGGTCGNGENGSFIHDTDSPDSEDVVSARESLSSEERSPDGEYSDHPSSTLLEGEDVSRRITCASSSVLNSESSDSDSSEDPDVSQTFPCMESREEDDPDMPTGEDSSPSKTEVHSKIRTAEDFATWQRIIRVDAVRANSEWIPYSPAQAAVSEGRARCSAEAVGLKDYDHLEPSRIFHAARLVAILEAYALYDPEIGYCQGMSDLLSPIISVILEDHEAFWCFVGFMRKARHNFRLDEIGIRRQLNTVSKIIKSKDSHLYRHLEKLQAEDCFFVYRMVVVLFRRELSFEQTVCLWEVMWADQAAVRAGIGKSAWSRIRQRAPPTDDLLLYAIAASVLQKRKLIIEKYSSMDEIIRECNSMAGHLDVWKLLNDAHDLVVSLHDKIETPFWLLAVPTTSSFTNL